MPELTKDEWRVHFGADSVSDYARAAAAAVATRGHMDEGAWDAVRDFQRAADLDNQDGTYDEETAFEVARRARMMAPAAYSFGAEYDVEGVQARLNALGYQPPLVADGVPGNKTATALRWFQAGHGLPATGVLDAATYKLLGVVPGVTKKPALTRIPVPPVPGLQQVVSDSFLSFSQPLEGYTPYLYTDSYGLVTTGMGNLVDTGKRVLPSQPQVALAGTPPESALSLPWKKPDGSAASRAEIAAAWQAVKAAWPRVKSTASQSLTNLRLSKEDVAKLVASKLAENQKYLISKYPEMASWPADAQLAFHAVSWAWGPGFAQVSWGPDGQNFVSAVNASPPDFRTAAEILMRVSAAEEKRNPGIIPRNQAVVLMLQNAASAIEKGSDLALLFYPNPIAMGLGLMLAAERAVPFWAKMVMSVLTISGLGVLVRALLRKA